MTGREIRTINGEFGGGNGLSLDTIKELQVISNGFKAETGQTGAGTISVITKSGTNTPTGQRVRLLAAHRLDRGEPIDRPQDDADAPQFGGDLRRTDRQGRHALFRELRGSKINDASVVTSVLEPGTYPAPQHAAPGLLQGRSPVQRPQRARRALQLQPQHAGKPERRRPEYLRHAAPTRRADRRFVTSLCQQLRLEQSERGAVPLHLRHRGLRTRR